jgi:hypothetical protein
MADKSKVKSKAKPKTAVKKMVKPQDAPKRAVSKPEKPVVKEKGEARQTVERSSSPARPAASAKRVAGLMTERRKSTLKQATLRHTQFNFMKAPGAEYAFEVGDTVEVFCDHDKNRDRIRGWVKGIIVQVDHKLAAVQFRSNVYLTDGWMVPDRILWFPINSEHIRPVTTGKKPAEKKEFIPDY